MFLLSCQKSGECPAPSLIDGTQIRVEASAIETRAGLTTDDLTSFGMIVNSADDDFDYPNSEVTYSGSAWSTATELKWKDAATAVEFIAYAPYSDIEILSFAVQTDQSTLTASQASDFLYAKASVTPETPDDTQPIYYNAATSSLQVNLGHKLSMLTVSVDIHAAIAAGNPAPISAITVSGLATTADVNLAAGTVSNPTVIADITPYHGGVYTPSLIGTQTSFNVIVPAQSVASGFSITIVIGTAPMAIPYTWTATETATFVEGMNHALPLSIGSTIEAVAPLTIVPGPWDSPRTTTHFID